MKLFEYLLLGALIVCAIGANLTRRLLPTVLIYMVFSVVMSVIWLLLQAPDLAITEAAVGAGVDTVIFLLAMKGIKQLKGANREEWRK
jgi:energy-converting hydrogenase B subunit D